MREIKFRGKSVDGFWVSGSLLQREIAEKLVSMICTAAIVDNKFIVKNETIGQFTGLCDCEGKEIYEGDIVKFTKPAYTDVPVVITWEDGAFMVDHELYLRGRDLSRVTIIGNIHDNPGLLERKP